MFGRTGIGVLRARWDTPGCEEAFGKAERLSSKYPNACPRPSEMTGSFSSQKVGCHYQGKLGHGGTDNPRSRWKWAGQMPNFLTRVRLNKTRRGNPIFLFWKFYVSITYLTSILPPRPILPEPCSDSRMRPVARLGTIFSTRSSICTARHAADFPRSVDLLHLAMDKLRLASEDQHFAHRLTTFPLMYDPKMQAACNDVPEANP